MSKRIFAVLGLAFSTLVGLSALDFSPYGFTENGTRVVDGVNYTVLADTKGAELLFSQLVEPTPERLTALSSIVAMLHSWDGLTLASVRAVNDRGQLQVTAYPSSLLVGGKDLKANLPGGLVFWFDTSVEYDFRVLSGAFAVKMSGLFTTSQNLAESLSLAASDPAKWLLMSDPEYAVKRITELSARVDTLESSLAAARSDIDGLRTSLATLSSAAAASDELTAKSDARLEAAIMTALNVGFFSGPKPIPQASVDWVVAKKKADPSLGKAALVAAAKAEKVQVSEKEIGIILLVMFGER